MNETMRVADAIYKQVFVRYCDECVDNLNQLPLDRANASWAIIAKFYRQLPDGDREAVNDFVRSLVADATSIILGGLDGVTDLDTLDGDIAVTYNEKVVSGDLQDNFMAAVEKFMSAKR